MLTKQPSSHLLQFTLPDHSVWTLPGESVARIWAYGVGRHAAKHGKGNPEMLVAQEYERTMADDQLLLERASSLYWVDIACEVLQTVPSDTNTRQPEWWYERSWAIAEKVILAP